MISSDIQSLEPGQVVTLYVVDGSSLGADTYYFHSYAQTGPIVWQGIEYNHWPVDASGFEMSGNSSPTPRVKLGNVGGFITALCQAFGDLAGAQVRRLRTLGKYLDGQPEADPNEHFPDELWHIEQKLAENSEYVEFELANALDFNGVQLPRRQIIANNCAWRYRDANCGYMGPPVADELDNPTTDPERDQCGYRNQSCKMRFGEDSPLPFGGFPASSLIR